MATSVERDDTLCGNYVEGLFQKLFRFVVQKVFIGYNVPRIILWLIIMILQECIWFDWIMIDVKYIYNK